MARGDVHTRWHSDTNQWYNNIEADPQPAFGMSPTKPPAQAAGRAEAIARNVEHFIHERDGTIGERNSYGNDPRRSPG